MAPQVGYPEEYRFLLDNVYPGLRHSDYAVEYVIRSYADVAEIRELIKTTPQKLSLHEMFVLAQSLEPGSDEYREVFEVAVRMYPEDPVANLNAANIALGRDELDRAEVYLAKAGDAPEAVYARGILAAKTRRLRHRLQPLRPCRRCRLPRDCRCSRAAQRDGALCPKQGRYKT